MMMKQDRKRIQQIIDGMQCPKNFICVESEFEDLCRARDFGDEKSLQCLEEISPPCPFAGVYDYGFEMRFCRCPLRVYIARHLWK